MSARQMLGRVIDPDAPWFYRVGGIYALVLFVGYKRYRLQTTL